MEGIITGRIVHYNSQHKPCRAGMIVDVPYEDSFFINIKVFADGILQEDEVVSSGYSNPEPPFSYTWHWPDHRTE